MSTHLEQALADLEEKRSMDVFKLYRSWSVEHALVEIESRLTASCQDGLGAARPHLSLHPRRSWVVAALGGLVIWAVLLALLWWAW